MKRSAFVGAMLVSANVLLWCVAGGAQRADRPGGTPDLPVNPAVQRKEIIAELREIRKLLQEQNELLRGGPLKVTVVQ